MTDDQNEDVELPNAPKKLANRINELDKEETQVDEPLIDLDKIQLTSAHPVSVVEFFLYLGETGWANWTFRDFSYDLTRFLEYCEYRNITDLRELSGPDFQTFKEWRKRDGHICLTTLHAQLANIRVFVRWAEEYGLVQKGLADGIDMPELKKSDVVSYVRLFPDEAEAIIDYHENVPYVTREYAEFLLMWEGLFRLGDVRALDLVHYDRENQRIEIAHNPEEGTPLKNGAAEVEGLGGERIVNLPDWVCDALNTYIDGTGDPNHPSRIDTTDDYGREPFFTSKFRGVSESSVRRDVYRITQPCRYDAGCPHDKDPRECTARNDNNKLSKCPENVSPHPVRRGGICHQLQQGVPKSMVCGRANVSLDVLNQHYDLRTHEEACEQRREELRKRLEGYDSLPANPAKMHWLLREVPVLHNTAIIARNRIDILGDPPSRARAAKGLTGYVGFVVLTGINLGLVGLGFDPIAGQVIFEIGV